MPAKRQPSIPDARWMGQAVDLARRGIGLTSPNPPVGAVLVSGEGQIIGTGYHRKAGLPHAEIEVLESAETLNRRLIAGSTLYVTLEPCSTQGKTPPCTDAIRHSGIRRVVFGAADPNPLHTGKAYSILGSAGIQVLGGVLEEECKELIKPFSKWVSTGMPYVIVKVGQTLDGRITRPPGEPAWITSDSARSHARRLRARCDAVIIGAETLRKDNPRLTLRDADTGTGKEQPWRVVLTRSGNLPREAHVFNDEFKERTVVLRGLSFVDVLKELGRQGILTVLVEGGGIVIGQAFQARAVDEVHWYIAPRLSGGGRPSIAGLPLPHSIPLDQAKVMPIADNVCISGFPIWPKDEPVAPESAAAKEPATAVIPAVPASMASSPFHFAPPPLPPPVTQA